MLLNNFFEILELKSLPLEPDSYYASIKLNENHPIYQGHFPGNPVAPGVTLTQIIKELIEEILGTDLILTKADNIKFLNFINPSVNQVLQLDISVKKSEAIQVKATIYDREKIFVKFSGVFTQSFL